MLTKLNAIASALMWKMFSVFLFFMLFIAIAAGIIFLVRKYLNKRTVLRRGGAPTPAAGAAGGTPAPTPATTATPAAGATTATTAATAAATTTAAKKKATWYKKPKFYLWLAFILSSLWVLIQYQKGPTMRSRSYRWLSKVLIDLPTDAPAANPDVLSSTLPTPAQTIALGGTQPGPTTSGTSAPTGSSSKPYKWVREVTPAMLYFTRPDGTRYTRPGHIVRWTPDSKVFKVSYKDNGVYATDEFSWMNTGTNSSGRYYRVNFPQDPEGSWKVLSEGNDTTDDVFPIKVSIHVDTGKDAGKDYVLSIHPR